MKLASPKIKVERLVPLEAFLAGAAPRVDDVTLPPSDDFQIDFDRTRHYAVVGGPAREMRDPSARDHRLGRGASFDDARAANTSPLDDGGLPAGFGPTRLPAAFRPGRSR